MIEFDGADNIAGGYEVLAQNGKLNLNVVNREPIIANGISLKFSAKILHALPDDYTFIYDNLNCNYEIRENPLISRASKDITIAAGQYSSDYYLYIPYSELNGTTTLLRIDTKFVDNNSIFGKTLLPHSSVGHSQDFYAICINIREIVLGSEYSAIQASALNSAKYFVPSQYSFVGVGSMLEVAGGNINLYSQPGAAPSAFNLANGENIGDLSDIVYDVYFGSEAYAFCSNKNSKATFYIVYGGQLHTRSYDISAPVNCGISGLFAKEGGFTLIAYYEDKLIAIEKEGVKSTFSAEGAIYGAVSQRVTKYKNYAYPNGIIFTILGEANKTKIIEYGAAGFGNEAVERGYDDIGFFIRNIVNSESYLPEGYGYSHLSFVCRSAEERVSFFALSLTDFTVIKKDDIWLEEDITSLKSIYLNYDANPHEAFIINNSYAALQWIGDREYALFNIGGALGGSLFRSDYAGFNITDKEYKPYSFESLTFVDGGGNVKIIKNNRADFATYFYGFTNGTAFEGESASVGFKIKRNIARSVNFAFTLSNVSEAPEYEGVEVQFAYRLSGRADGKQEIVFDTIDNNIIEGYDVVAGVKFNNVLVATVTIVDNEEKLGALMVAVDNVLAGGKIVEGDTVTFTITRNGIAGALMITYHITEAGVTRSFSVIMPAGDNSAEIVYQVADNINNANSIPVIFEFVAGTGLTAHTFFQETLYIIDGDNYSITHASGKTEIDIFEGSSVAFDLERIGSNFSTNNLKVSLIAGAEFSASRYKAYYQDVNGALTEFNLANPVLNIPKHRSFELGKIIITSIANGAVENTESINLAIALYGNNGLLIGKEFVLNRIESSSNVVKLLDSQKNEIASDGNLYEFSTYYLRIGDNVLSRFELAAGLTVSLTEGCGYVTLTNYKTGELINLGRTEYFIKAGDPFVIRIDIASNGLMDDGCELIIRAADNDSEYRFEILNADREGTVSFEVYSYTGVYNGGLFYGDTSVLKATRTDFTTRNSQKFDFNVALGEGRITWTGYYGYSAADGIYFNDYQSERVYYFIYSSTPAYYHVRFDVAGQSQSHLYKARNLASFESVSFFDYAPDNAEWKQDNTAQLASKVFDAAGGGYALKSESKSFGITYNSGASSYVPYFSMMKTIDNSGAVVYFAVKDNFFDASEFNGYSGTYGVKMKSGNDEITVLQMTKEEAMLHWSFNWIDIDGDGKLDLFAYGTEGTDKASIVEKGGKVLVAINEGSSFSVASYHENIRQNGNNYKIVGAKMIPTSSDSVAHIELYSFEAGKTKIYKASSGGQYVFLSTVTAEACEGGTVYVKLNKQASSSGWADVKLTSDIDYLDGKVYSFWFDTNETEKTFAFQIKGNNFPNKQHYVKAEITGSSYVVIRSALEYTVADDMAQKAESVIEIAKGSTTDFLFGDQIYVEAPLMKIYNRALGEGYTVKLTSSAEGETGIYTATAKSYLFTGFLNEIRSNTLITVVADYYAEDTGIKMGSCTFSKRYYFLPEFNRKVKLVYDGINSFDGTSYSIPLLGKYSIVKTVSIDGTYAPLDHDYELEIFDDVNNRTYKVNANEFQYELTNAVFGTDYVNRVKVYDKYFKQTYEFVHEFSAYNAEVNYSFAAVSEGSTDTVNNLDVTITGVGHNFFYSGTISGSDATLRDVKLISGKKYMLTINKDNMACPGYTEYKKEFFVSNEDDVIVAELKYYLGKRATMDDLSVFVLDQNEFRKHYYEMLKEGDIHGNFSTQEKSYLINLLYYGMLGGFDNPDNPNFSKETLGNIVLRNQQPV